MTSGYYKEKAQRCRLMLAVAMVPEIREQLRLWAHEFDDLAEAAERREKRHKRLRGWRNRIKKAFNPHAA
jgi:hypothetical protein